MDPYRQLPIRLSRRKQRARYSFANDFGHHGPDFQLKDDVWSDAVLLEGLVDDETNSMWFGRQHERNALKKVLETHRTSRHRIFGSMDQVDPLADEPLVDHVMIDLNMADHATVQLAVQKIAADVAGPRLADLQPDVWKLRPDKLVELGGHSRLTVSGTPILTSAEAPVKTRISLAFSMLSQNCGRVPQELTTRRSGHHPSSVASEKPHIEFALEQSDLPAEGRLST